MLRLLGSVEVWAGPDRLVTGSPRQCLIIAALAVNAGSTVSLDVLVDRIWGAAPPPQVRRTVHSYIARARRVVEQMPPGPGGPVRLAHTAGGYRLELSPDRIDVHRFRRLVEQARGLPGADRRAPVLREAVGLWRGDALIGLDGQWAERMRRSWQHERVSAAVAWAEAELTAGHPGVVEGPLRELAAEFPLDEPLAGALMKVLAAAGFKAKALDAYAVTRGRLAEELGVDPGPDLRAIHRALVRGELDPRPRPIAVIPAAEPVPAQLPPGLPSFTGREPQLRTLAALAGQAARRPVGGVAAVISGPAGIGKTAVALHAAHHAAALFPDGQLYLDLHGSDPVRRMAEATSPIRQLLDGLNVPASRVPEAPEAQTALYRSRTAGLRLLLVLDNARDAAQVRPLLPGSPGCLVLVTSRDDLVDLVAADGAVPVPLGPLTAGGARHLLSRRLGAQRVAAEPEAVGELVEWCAGVPAALASIAARAAIHPERRLSALAATLPTPGPASRNAAA